MATPIRIFALALGLLTTTLAATAHVRPAPAADGRATSVFAPEGPTGTATATTLATTANLTEFSRLINAAGLKPRLKRAGEAYTVFAPTNDAIKKLPNNVREQMLRTDNPGLKTLVRTHIIKGAIPFEQLTDGRELETIDGRIIRVARQADGSVLLDGVYRLTDTGRTTTNGVVYALETVIAPL